MQVSELSAPPRKRVEFRLERKSRLLGTVGVHYVDLTVAVTQAREGELGAIRRPRGKVVAYQWCEGEEDHEYITGGL